MNVSAPFIRRPVATTLLMVAIFAGGVAGYRGLPVSDLPNVDFPTLVVTASLPGATPETMASAVATPLERQFSTIAGVTAINSVNLQGGTQITLQFDLARPIDAAAQDVQAAITQAQPLLPAGMPSPPVARKVNPADQPILFLGLYSDTLPLWMLDEYAQTLIAQRISMVSGVAQVLVFGSQKYAVRVKADPRRLASQGLTTSDLVRAIRSANVNLPTGTLHGAERAFAVEAAGQLTSAALFQPTIVAWRAGAPVRLGDVAEVLDGVEDDKSAAWYADHERIERALIVAIQRQPGTNTVAVAERVKALLPTLTEWLPPAARIDVLSDRSRTIQESITDVRTTMGIAFVLVVLVIFAFLRNVSATVIASLALPLSIVGTFAVMPFFGFSLDNLSLMALTLAIGFVVDDAIVVLENIVRHMEAGEPALDAALNGTREIGFTIVSMTLSLAAVFLPVLFMPGIVGRLFNEFAVTIVVAILVSGVVSLTLTPMLCARFLRPPGSERHGAFYLGVERVLDRALGVYAHTLDLILARQQAALWASLGLLLVTGWLFLRVPKGFIPSEDQRFIFGVVEAQEGVSFEAMSRQMQAVLNAIRDDPGVRALSGNIAASAAGTGAALNLGRIFIHLKPRHERGPIGEVLQRVRARAASVPGIRPFLQVPPPVRIGGQFTKSLYQITLQSPNTAELWQAAPALETVLRQLPGLIDVASDLQIRNPQLRVEMHRDRASALGISAEEIESTLYDAFGDRWVSTIYAPNNQYRVILEVDEPFQRDPEALERLHLRASDGGLVPFGAVATITRGAGPLTVNHAGQLPSVTLSFSLAPGTALGEAVERVTRAARDTLPAGITTSFQGTAQAFEASFRGLWVLLVLSVLVIYIVLGILYESFVHPLTILSGLPSAGFGALATLMLFGLDLDIYSFVGLIMLVGIVKKNAIMQIDFAIAAQRDGQAPLAAIRAGCLVRFRPIMMTTLAALLGTLPIALGLGAGAEARRPLGVAVVGGLLFSQLVTLYLTPVYYLALERLDERRRERRASVIPLPI